MLVTALAIILKLFPHNHRKPVDLFGWQLFAVALLCWCVRSARICVTAIELIPRGVTCISDIGRNIYF